ncbi:MAG: hypothetical protein HZB16_24945 [Armatimonadetes bacterium]|nr:hypothetical protein [Armatimonadota bacterium]
MIRRRWLLAAVLGTAGLLCGPVRAQTAERAKVQLVDATVEADECQYRPGSFVCVGKVVLKAKMQGDQAQLIIVTADKVTVTMAKPKNAKPNALTPGPLATVLAEGNVHYDLTNDDAAAATAQQVVGDCQKMTYDAAAATLVLNNADQPVVSTITNTQRPTPENKLTKAETATVVLTARRTLQITLSDESPSGK